MKKNPSNKNLIGYNKDDTVNSSASNSIISEKPQLDCILGSIKKEFSKASNSTLKKNTAIAKTFLMKK